MFSNPESTDIMDFQDKGIEFQQKKKTITKFHVRVVMSLLDLDIDSFEIKYMLLASMTY